MKCAKEYNNRNIFDIYMNDTRTLYYGSNVFCDFKLSDSKQKYIIKNGYDSNKRIRHLHKYEQCYICTLEIV